MQSSICIFQKNDNQSAKVSISRKFFCVLIVIGRYESKIVVIGHWTLDIKSLVGAGLNS